MTRGGSTLPAVHQSLRALQTEVIDVMHLHSASVEEIRHGDLADILQELQKAGSIRFLGATTYGEDASLAALQDGRFDCIQIAYNLLDREPEGQKSCPWRNQRTWILVRSVLLKGALTQRYSHLPGGLEELKSAVEEILAIAKAGSSSLPEFAYRFVLAHPVVSTALVGTAFVDELQAAVAYCTRGPLSSQTQAAVRQVIIKDRRLLNPGNWPPLQ